MFPAFLGICTMRVLAWMSRAIGEGDGAMRPVWGELPRNSACTRFPMLGVEACVPIGMAKTLGPMRVARRGLATHNYG